MTGFKRQSRPTSSKEAGPEGSERVALCERCQFEVAASGAPREGIVWNVSAVGLYLVVHTEIPAMGAAVSVSLWLPGDPVPVHAGTEVVWCNPPSPFRGCGAKALRFPPGCGLKFVDIAASDLARIRSRVETVFPAWAGQARDPNRR